MITKTKNNKKVSNLFKATLLSLFAFVPWVWSSTKDALPFIEVNPASVGYYQTNICDISFIKLLFSSFFNNLLVLTTTNVENISCVGKIMGMDNIDGKIAVYIGTNQVIDVLFQTIFWIGLICFVKKDHLNLKSNYLPVLAIPLIFCLQILGEQRFYLLLHKGYKNTINLENYYLLNYLLAYLIIALLIKEFVVPRASNLINYFPFVFFVVGTFNLVNTNIYLIIGSFFGIMRLQRIKIFNTLNLVYLFFATMWLSLSSYQNSFFDVDKLRGFSNSSSTFSSKLFWIIVVFLTINGLWYLLKISNESINLEKLRVNFLISGAGITIFGVIGSLNPITNFLNQYYFGQNKKGIDKIFSIDGNTWRGFASSAEAVGEFFAFILLFNCLILFWDNKRIKLAEIPFLIICICGLIRANNSAAIISLLIFLITLLIKRKIKVNKKRRVFLFTLISLITVIGTYFIIDYYSYGSLSKGLLFNAFQYSNLFIGAEPYFNNLNYFENNNIESILLFNDQGKNVSSSIIFLLDKFTPENNIKFIPNPVAVVSFISVIINRSEKWGLFLAKYNPEFSEFLFGYGPVQFNEYYSSSTSTDISGLILPHSSFLSLLIFSGLLGIISVLAFFIHTIKTYKENGSFIIYLLFFQIVNLVKSDSLAYISSLFLLIFTIYLVNNSSNIFEREKWS